MSNLQRQISHTDRPEFLGSLVLFGILPLAHILMHLLTSTFAQPEGGDAACAIQFGLGKSELILLSVWIALGTSPLVKRLICAAVVSTFGVFALSIDSLYAPLRTEVWTDFDWLAYFSSNGGLLSMCLPVHAGMILVALVAARRFGLRLERLSSTQEDSAGGSRAPALQFSIADLLLVATGVSLICGVVVSVQPYPMWAVHLLRKCWWWADTPFGIFVILLSGLHSLVTAASALWATMASQTSVARIVLLFAIVVLTDVLAQQAFAVFLLEPKWPIALSLNFFIQSAITTVSVTGSLLVVRSCGYRVARA